MALHYASASQPMIVKYIQQERNGIQAHNLTRHCIGYVVHGQKYVYYGDVRYLIDRGNVFYLGLGNHYTEDLPENDKCFEQISFYYTSEQLSRILNHLNINYLLDIQRDHTSPESENHPHVITPSWNVLRSFFASTDQYLKDGLFNENQSTEMIKITELIFLILLQSENHLRSKILSSMDVVKVDFEQIVLRHVFEDILIEDLARKCNRSLTSFKKDFRKQFNEPPHKWFIRQRLMHARLLLISTRKSISEVGAECRFPNTSHFIKLFKKEYAMTPAQYRSQETIVRSVRAK